MATELSEGSISILRVIVRATIIILTLLVILLVALWYSRQPRPNHNTLALGPRTAAGVQEPVEIGMQAPLELDGMSRSEVFELRREAVQRQAQLIAGQYEPSEAVFGQIVDGKPWWGMTGQFYYGPGEKSPAGPAEQSRFILNPYLLVAAEFFGLSIWGEDRFWNTDVAAAAALSQPDFPLVCSPEGLRWQPSQKRGEVTYDLSGYLERLAPWTSRQHTLADTAVDLNALNARDLNLNYIQFMQAESTNVRLMNPFDSPISNPEFIHLGGSCKYPGGCNNGSPYVAKFSEVVLQILPARLTVYLWKNRPWLANQTPDMIFVLHFK